MNYLWWGIFTAFSLAGAIYAHDVANSVIAYAVELQAAAYGEELEKELKRVCENCPKPISKFMEMKEIKIEEDE